MKKIIEWKNFTVLSIKGSLPNQFCWTPPKDIIPIETCARHLYFGLQSSFSGLPKAILEHPRTKLLSGEKGYEFFLTIYTGLGTKRKIDKDMSGQIWKRWKEHKSEKTSLYPYMLALKRDGTMIFNKLLMPHLRQPTVQNAAVELANLSPERKALIIGGSEAITISLIKALGHKKKTNPNQITLIHKNPSLGQMIITEINNLRNYNKLDTFPSLVQPEKFKISVLETDAVFVCSPMVDDNTHPSPSSSNHISDPLLCNWWKQRKKGNTSDTAKLIHLKGTPLSQGKTSGPWKNLEKKDGFISFKDLTAYKELKLKRVKGARRKALEAISFFREKRMKNLLVYNFYLNPESESLHYHIETPKKQHPIKVNQSAAATPESMMALCRSENTRGAKTAAIIPEITPI
ncbi:MAG TPA: hypothetical protein DD400_04895 [Rhodospirillaceae bacterium]|nr:hypothetical protein [Rhodospirillaceae bacterium]